MEVWCKKTVISCQFCGIFRRSIGAHSLRLKISKVNCRCKDKFLKGEKMRITQLLSILVAGTCLVVFIGQVAFAGTITGWGDNWVDKASPPSGSDYVVTAAGGHHGLALKSDGSLVGWGWDNSGQATPPAGNDYVAVSSGLAHSIALKANGSIVGWGLNANGQATPPAGSDYVAIAAGGWHSLALEKDGSIVGWGSNGYGQATPPAGNDYTAIDAEGRHSLALKTDRSIVAWGISNEGAYDFGQVTDAPTDSNYMAIAAGWYHNIALKTDGSIVAWGINDGSADDYGQVTDTPTGNGFIAIAAGHWHNLALKADGTIIGWGRDNYNQTTPPTGKDFVAIGAGGDFSLVLTESVIGTGFIYQGRLIDADYPADDVYDFRFELYNDMTAGMQQGNTIYRDDVGVSDGYFTVGLDFGMDVIDSNALWLEIGVRPGDVNDPNLYTRLSPRQRITPTPYAVHASSSETVQTPLELSGSVAAPYSVLLVENHLLNGSAIRGENSDSGTYGYLGSNTDGVHGWGGLAGVMGQNSSGYGMWATSISGSGVYAEQFNSGNYGCLATGDHGVYGRGMATSSYGVYGIHNSSGNYGYLGTSNSGVYGSSSSGHAGYFQGKTRVTANLIVDGKVGIGTADPNYKLYVIDDSYESYFKTAGYFEMVAHSARAVTGVASSTVVGPSYGGHFTAASLEGRGVYGEASNTLSTTNYGGYFKALGGKGRGVYGGAFNDDDEINYGGYFEANKRGVYALATGSSGIGVYGEGELYDFYAHHGRTNYGAASSIRWKSNIQAIDNPLDKVLQLRGVYFDWDQEHGGEHDVGMIAEEVGKVLPEIVRYEEDGIYTSGMDYSKLTPLLVEAIKELKKENDLLKRRIEVLERNR